MSLNNEKIITINKNFNFKIKKLTHNEFLSLYVSFKDKNGYEESEKMFRNLNEFENIYEIIDIKNDCLVCLFSKNKSGVYIKYIQDFYKCFNLESIILSY